MEYKTNTEASTDNSQIAIIRQKIVCVGDIAVGKTSIINSFLEVKFRETYEVNNFHLNKFIFSLQSVLIFHLKRLNTKANALSYKFGTQQDKRNTSRLFLVI